MTRQEATVSRMQHDDKKPFCYIPLQDKCWYQLLRLTLNTTQQGAASKSCHWPEIHSAPTSVYIHQIPVGRARHLQLLQTADLRSDFSGGGAVGWAAIFNFIPLSSLKSPHLQLEFAGFTLVGAQRTKNQKNQSEINRWWFVCVPMCFTARAVLKSQGWCVCV